MAKMKVFYGNYDGRRHAMVACTSQKKVAELIGTSLNDIRNYYSDGSTMDDAYIAFNEPETVFLQDMRAGAEWVKKQGKR